MMYWIEWYVWEDGWKLASAYVDEAGKNQIIEALAAVGFRAKIERMAV